MMKLNKTHPLFWLLIAFVIALGFGNKIDVKDYIPKPKPKNILKYTPANEEVINYSKFIYASLQNDDKAITKYGSKITQAKVMEKVIWELIANLDFDLALKRAKQHPKLNTSKIIIGFNAFKLKQYKDTIKYLKDSEFTLSKLAVIIAKRKLGQDYTITKELKPFINPFKTGNPQKLMAEFMVLSKDAFFTRFAHFMDSDNFNVMVEISSNLLKYKQYEKLAEFAKKFPNTDSAKLVFINIIDSIPKKQSLQSKKILNLIDKDDKSYNFAYAIYELRQKQYEKALSAIKKVNGFDDNYLFNFYYGIILDKNKMRIQAIEKLKIANKQSKGEPNISNYLSYTMIEENIDLENNLTKLLIAYKELPADFIADSVGWAYYKLGEYDKALEYMNVAIKGLPSDGVVNDHLGDVYLKLGRTNEAIIQWKRAIELDPDNMYIDIEVINNKIKKYSNETNVHQ